MQIKRKRIKIKNWQHYQMKNMRGIPNSYRICHYYYPLIIILLCEMETIPATFSPNCDSTCDGKKPTHLNSIYEFKTTETIELKWNAL